MDYSTQSVQSASVPCVIELGYLIVITQRRVFENNFSKHNYQHLKFVVLRFSVKVGRWVVCKYYYHMYLSNVTYIENYDNTPSAIEVWPIKWLISKCIKERCARVSTCHQYVASFQRGKDLETYPWSRALQLVRYTYPIYWCQWSHFKWQNHWYRQTGLFYE